MAGTKIFDIQVKPDFWSKMPSKQIQNEANAVVGMASKRLAEFLADKTKRVIGKDMVISGAKGPIGASGNSANRIATQEGSKGKNGTTWLVVELPGGANELIRKGIKPDKSLSIDRVMQWVAQKGITVTYIKSKRDESVRLQTVKGYETTRGKRVDDYIRARPNKWKGPQSRNDALIAYYKIRQSLKSYGTERPESSWYDLYPSGKGRFDYVYYVRNTYQNQINNLMDSYYDSDIRTRFTAIIDRMMSGRKSVGGVSKHGG